MKMKATFFNLNSRPHFHLLMCGFLIFSCSRNNNSDDMTQIPLRNYKVAMVQMEVEAGKLDANLARAKERIATAAQQGAKIVLLPEVMDLGWTDPSARELAFEIPDGKTCKALRDAAKHNNIYVCAGIVEKD